MDGCEGFVRQEYFEGNDQPWDTLANGNKRGAMYYGKLRPADRILGISVGIYLADGTPVDDPLSLASFEVFMLERRLAEYILKIRRVPNTPNPDIDTYAALRAQTEGKSFRGGITSDSDQPRENYYTNFGRGWRVGGSRRPLNPAPYLFIRWEFGHTVDFPADLHINACLELWRPAEKRADGYTVQW
jgi:hypothetical protein